MTTTPSGGRHRRRIRIALPVAVAAAGVAAAVAATLMTSSAGAATAVPNPTIKPAIGSPSLSTLEKRIAGALAGDDTPGQTTEKSSLSSGTSTSSIDPKIIGGSETTIGTAPWMAQLWYHDDRNTPETNDDVSFFCGGAVVAPTKILTAAHCVRDGSRDYNWQAHGAVVTGTAQLPTADSTGTTDLHGGQATAVLRQWWQPGYDPVDKEVGRYGDDLGMLTPGQLHR
ncbi:trypsin-like serine protease [Streptomyces azureus]|uniref:Putative FG-GAP repeat domain-containing protein n=1 Tax=Streptomyces azureus TaxID=146537 RepID=A0A0K8PQC2_STRAJ|nr:putative FG-GAP repeat domain-containing protein [Streptomyces azureus]